MVCYVIWNQNKSSYTLVSFNIIYFLLYLGRWGQTISFRELKKIASGLNQSISVTLLLIFYFFLAYF